MCKTRVMSLLLVPIAVVATIAPAAANTWPTTYFELVTGRPKAPEPGDEATIEPLTDAEADESWLPAEQRAEVEAYLHQVAERLRRWQFSEPFLPVHRPTQPRSDGAESVYRIHLNPLSDAGEYSGACEEIVQKTGPREQKEQQREKERGEAYISVDTAEWAYTADASNDGRPSLQWQHLNLLMLIAGHELFHAVQAGSPAYLYECDVPDWIEEGTADAIAYDLFREFKGFKPMAGHYDTPAELHGLRNYDKPLEETDPEKEEGYLTQSFWRYVAERNGAIRRQESLPGPQWGKSDYTYLDILLDSTEIPSGQSEGGSSNKSLEFVKWVDRTLREETALAVGLRRLLPDFLSVMAGFPGERAGDVKMEKWMQYLCGHKPERDLLLEEQFRLADFEAPMSARGCVSFSVDRDAALGASPLSITITAAADSEEVASELSLGEAGGQRVMHGSLSAGCKSGKASCEVSWTWLLDSPGPKYFVMTAVRPKEPEKTKGHKKLGIAVSTGGVDANLSEPPNAGKGRSARNTDSGDGPGGAMDTARERIEEGSTRLTNNGVFTGTVEREYFDDGGGELVIQLGTAHGIGDVLGSTLGAGGVLRQAIGSGQLIDEYYRELMAAELSLLQ